MKKITVKDLIAELSEIDQHTKVTVLVECKACFSVNIDNRARFYRLDTKERKKNLCSGYKCTSCGYLNDEPND
jgi:hypothetical protein